MATNFPRRSDPNMADPYGTIQYPQPPQVQAYGTKETRDGQALLKANAPGKLNENRFSSLKPSRNDK
jgi:hypothetical protein